MWVTLLKRPNSWASGQSLVYSIQQSNVPQMMVLRKGSAAAHYLLGGPQGNDTNAFSIGTAASKEQVYHDLNHIVQSSAVECINSIIRPYLNTSHNQISQKMLNLIMFYHNHRRYNSGERAKKTPYEILSGKKQEKDWLALLFDIIGDVHTSTGKTQRFRHSGSLLCENSHHFNLRWGASDDYSTTVLMSPKFSFFIPHVFISNFMKHIIWWQVEKLMTDEYII